MQITYLQAVILGLLQGVSELFPVSSLGHSVILPDLLGWHIQQDQTSTKHSFFLTFLIATHLATALVLVGFFWKDWVRIVKAMGKSLKDREVRADDIPARTGWLVVIGTIPAGILGAVFEEPLRAMFTSSRVAAGFLIANGALLYAAELLRRRAVTAALSEDPDAEISKLPWWKAVCVGAVQAIALIPGFSRSGAAMSGGLLVGLNNEDSARFTFLLATPIILAAALLNVPELFDPKNQSLLGPCLVGAICSGITAFLAVRFLMKYFETNRLTPFAIYCAAAGIVTSAIFLLRK
ncbi:MAG TPA: undecaprenyl-diphosphate phosphatase [Fimbriimonadaceae bacterium]|jgi:undecaprenyl-diphosphatase